MEAPEKIHIQPNAHDRWFEGKIPSGLPNGLFVEYTRTGAFIEKACDAYCKVCGHYAHTTPVHICRQACDYYKDFKKIYETAKLNRKNKL